MEYTPDPGARRTVRGVLAGGGLLVGGMVAIAGLAIALGLIDPDRAIDMTPWLTLEVLAGCVVCALSGWLSRRIGNTDSSPAILAGLILVLGSLEAAVVARYIVRSGADTPRWIVYLAPVAGAIAVLFGGMRVDGWRGARRIVWLRRPGFAIPPILLLGTAAIAATALPEMESGAKQDVVAAALTLDFTVVVPAAVFWFWVRAHRVRWIALLPAFVIGYVVAAATLPPEHRGVLDVARWLVVPAELALVACLLVAARRAFRRTSGHLDFVERLRGAAFQALGARLPADIITTEVSILYHALRFRGRPHDRREVGFSCYRESGYSTIILAVGIAMVVETAAVHLLVSRWSILVAWSLTGLTIYALVWLVGDLRACVARATTIDGTSLRLRLGIRWEADVPLARIREVSRIAPGSAPRTTRARTLSLLGCPTVRLDLNTDVELIGLYGIRRTTREIRLRIDEVDRFCETLRARGVTISR